MTISILTRPSTQVFDLAGGGRIVLRRGWVHNLTERLVLLSRLRDLSCWQQRVFEFAGKRVMQPRLTAWWGDPGASYVYSGIRNEPQSWPAWIRDLRDRIADATGARFNSCLGNLYRDGRDSVVLHADDEPELGPEPTIASLSLGASRRFQLRHPTAAPIDMTLDDGDLLVMSGPMQCAWTHGVPKMARVDGPRVNLTFRWVEAQKR